MPRGDVPNQPIPAAETRAPVLPLQAIEVGRLLGVTKGRVTQLVSEGKLRRVGETFDPLEVCRLVLERQTSGKGATIVQLVFAMFDRGGNLHDVVRELGLPPEDIRALHAQYVTPLGAQVRTADDRAQQQKAEHEARMRGYDEEDRQRREQETKRTAEINRSLEPQKKRK